MAGSTAAVTRILEAARRKLLETGTRNRLIHVNRANLRANSLTIINERSDAVFDLLRAQGKTMRFKAMGKDRSGEGEGDETQLALPDDTLEPGAARFTDQFLETPLGPEALARRLLRMAGDARTAEEEQGLNILYLALGFLGWRESAASDVLREAPLILLPVELVRNPRTATFELVARDEDLTTNLPLQARLQQDFGLSLPEIDEAEGWTPAAYFDAVAEVIAAKTGWSIDRDGLQLGFFSFAKLLMHRDLDHSTWADDSLTGNPLLAGLLAEGFAADVPLFGPEDRLDALLDPADIIQVIDADASQTKVIEEVRRGASLVVQGPPGTGKSQTITNIIAAAAHDGKSVLFVAEKMAALSVVHDRLVRCGLRDVCLELHSRNANKKALAQELGRTLAASARAPQAVADVTRLRTARDDLNRIADLLHTPAEPGGESPFSAMSDIIGFLGQGATAPVIPLTGLNALGPEGRALACAALGRYVAALGPVGALATHPFRGAAALDLQPTDLARLDTELEAALAAIAALQGRAAELAQTLHQPAPEALAGIAALAAALRLLAAAPPAEPGAIRALFPRASETRLEEGLQAGAEWQAARGAADSLFAAPAWDHPLAEMRAGVLGGQTSFFARLFGAYRRASAGLATLLTGPLPKAPAERLALIDRLATVQALRKRLADDEAWLAQALGEEWRGERTPFAALESLRQWLAAVRQPGALRSAEDLLGALAALPQPESTAAALEILHAAAAARIDTPLRRLTLRLAEAGLGQTRDLAPLAPLADRFAQMRADMGRYDQWASLQRAMAEVGARGAGAIVTAVAEGRLDGARAVPEFLFACAEARWTRARQMRPGLDALSAMDRHGLVTLFRTLEKERLGAAQALILAQHFQQMPRGTLGEMGVIRGEIGRKRGHKPVRWVMRHAGSMVQRIKPVMLMSPLSVAQFLPPDSVRFDLLVIDEASQVRPEDALGVIARARQIVVVGDQKQLPPTSFFDRLVDEGADPDEDEEAPVGATAADMESILSLCEARGLRARMLEWHYRSRDPSLIRVSNAEFYGDGLVLPPSPLQLDGAYGLGFTRVPGVYARGGSGLGRAGTNRIEAEAVVAAVARHARERPGLSLGVVAFSKAQSDMLTEVMELERRRDPVLDAFLREGQHEDVFVKNIENVQGDERDVILISVGYGPQQPNGRLTAMSFGPVNGEGGERRLNVLFSRARVRCEVFASFDPGDIDPARTTREGPRVLKRFLDFARTGKMAEHSVTGLEADSPFEEDVARVIRSLGYEADAQVGSSGFRLDIGVRHPDRPGQYIAAVECDGAAYHSALWARERDRLRQDILEMLGWRFHRIWSTDWFHRRDAEIRRLAEALDSARVAALDGIPVRGANEGRELPVAPLPDDAAPIEIAHLHLTAPPYQRAALPIRSTVEPHEAPLAQLADLVARIVAVEGPVPVDEIARRIAAAFGKQRVGSRIAEATERAVARALQTDASLRRDGDFLLTAAQAESPPVRDRSAESGPLLRAAALPPMEIRAAAAMVRAESGGISDEELLRAVARLLGFQRVGPDMAAVLMAVLTPPEGTPPV